MAGQVRVSDALAKNLDSTQPNDWSNAELLGRIAMVFQEPQYQFLTPTVRQELAYGLERLQVPTNEIERKVDHYLHRLHLEHLAQAHPLTLSGGEKRRLSVGSALIAAPRVLIVDEPTFGQDYNTWTSLVELLISVAQGGTTIISVTHDPRYLQVMGQQTMTLPPPKAMPASEAAPGRQVTAAPTPQGAASRLDRAPIRRLNPVVTLGVLLLLTTPLLLTIDPVSAGIALGLELLFLPLFGLGPRKMLLRVSPVLLAAPLAGLSMLLYGAPGGTQYFQWGPVDITHNSAVLAGALTLRVLAVGIPAVLLLSTVNPTRMADALTQNLRLPPKVVFAALAGIRTVALAAEDWQALQRARRSRGAPGKGLLHGAFALLGFALRRAGVLSATMQARGFSGTRPRSIARPATFSSADALALVVAVTIPAAAITAAVVTGSFTWFGLR